MAIGGDETNSCSTASSRVEDQPANAGDPTLHDKGLHQCPKCEKSFAHRQILQLHIRVHEGGEQKLPDCTEAAAALGTVHGASQSLPSAAAAHQPQQLGLPQKKAVGLTKIRLEDCLRCDACSCIYIDKSDYNKHMRNFHQKVAAKKQKSKKECKSCCRHCNCKGNHKHRSVEKERGNNNLFHYSIKDRWTKMVSQRIHIEEVRQKIKQEPASSEPDNMDYSHLLSQVEVKIKTEPADDEYSMNIGIIS